jgi:hypothetical protein
MKEIDRYLGHEPGLEIVILRNDADKSFIKKCIYKTEVELLNIGDTTYHKRLDKLANHFPFVIFDILEAKKYGLEINCKNKNNFWTYHGLTCDPENLKLIEKISFEKAIGNHIKEDVFKCPKCGTKWNIKEEYDSHHGFNRNCTKIKE